MAYEGQSKAFVLSQRAASAVRAYAAVGVAAAGSQLDDSVIPVGSGALGVLGVTRASHAANDACEVITYGVAKMIAGASIGAGGALTVGSLGAIALLAASAPLGVVGKALTNAAAGDVFTVLVNPSFL